MLRTDRTRHIDGLSSLIEAGFTACLSLGIVGVAGLLVVSALSSSQIA